LIPGIGWLKRTISYEELPPVRRVLLGLILLNLAGCKSPEDGRPRGDGHGADGGNYVRNRIHVPSKIDGTKTWPQPSPSPKT
jgi:hypothetical protein